MKAFLSIFLCLFSLSVPSSAATFVLVHGAFEDASVEKVNSIATGHTPFLAKPAELARILLSIP